MINPGEIEVLSTPEELEAGNFRRKKSQFFLRLLGVASQNFLRKTKVYSL